MSEPVELEFAPGIITERTARGARGRFTAGNLVRFRQGLPESIGGWQAATAQTFKGACRALHDWTNLAINRYVGLGTSSKLYILSGGALNDITPLRLSGQLTGPFTTTNGSPVVRVAHTAHGAIDGAFVTYSNATAVGGITIDGEYVITVVDVNSYDITHSIAATSSAAGGGTVDYAYQINPGLIDTTAGLGWGTGTWGSGTWGTPRTSGGVLLRARTWSLDRWGEDLIANIRGEGIYHWDNTAGPSARATKIVGAPDTARFILISPENRQLIAFGAHDGTNDDPLLIRWSAKENFGVFTSTSTNTAGQRRLDTGNEIVSAIRARGEIAVFTDLSLHRLFFTGPPSIFGLLPVAGSCAISGPNAAVEHNGTVYFMGLEDFYVYDGVLREMPCEVRNHVFDDFNRVQRDKVYASPNVRFNEIWWLYPSASATENDRYVSYDYVQGVWSIGELARTAMLDRNVVYTNNPICTDINGNIFVHESGADANGQPMVGYLDSQEAEINAGGDIIHVHRLLPDFLELDGKIQVSLHGRRYPHGTQKTKGPKDVTASTERVDLRMRNRQIGIRIDFSELGSRFRMGTWRAEISPDGGR